MGADGDDCNLRYRGKVEIVVLFCGKVAKVATLMEMIVRGGRDREGEGGKREGG